MYLCNYLVNHSLPSTSINKLALLKSVVDVLNASRNLLIPGKASTLAVKLAREAFFGEEVLLKCTVAGGRGFYALPVDELRDMKAVIWQQFSTMPQSKFKAVWKDCLEAIGQACKRARDKSKRSY